ncbi:MAG: TetR/AcrR family transcriptional regulator [Acidobacteria bacterium]|nr:TetR/AcrR family transcriptional regulator [Acidobacteriota bacterium]
MAETNTVRRAAALPPSQRRAAIIEAVRPLLIEFGESVTSRQIASAAGIAEGTIFGVFADKDEVLSATLEAALDPQSLEDELAEIDASFRFDTRVRVATEIIQRRLVDLMRLVANLGPKLQEQAARPLAESVALTELFESADTDLRIEPARAARILKALTLSMSHPMLVGDPVPASEIAEVFLHGIAASP